MISSTNIDIDYSDNSTFYEFNLSSEKSIIGRYNIVVSENEISLSFFEIFKKYRKNGFGKKSLELIYKNINEIAIEYNLFELEICAKPLDNSISLSDLVKLYKKYLNVEIDYDNSSSIILRGNLSHI